MGSCYVQGLGPAPRTLALPRKLRWQDSEREGRSSGVTSNRCIDTDPDTAASGMRKKLQVSAGQNCHANTSG